MPVIAVAAAVYAGMTIATVGVAAMSTWAIIGSVGAIAAGVGAVTGNEDLMKIGSVMGIVGGVGALATSAGTMGSTAAEASASAGGTAAGATEAATSGAVAEQTMQGVFPATAGDATVVAGAAPDVASAVVDAAAAAPVDAVASVAPVAGGSAGGIVNTVAPTGGGGVADASFFSAIKDFAQPMADFAGKNQLLTYGMMQVGGGFMQGLFKEPTESENAQAELLKQRAANMSAPIPQATATARRDVYGTTKRPRYAAPGLINTVTGVPA